MRKTIPCSPLLLFLDMSETPVMKVKVIEGPAGSWLCLAREQPWFVVSSVFSHVSVLVSSSS